METKSFQDLIKEVHDRGICQECGGCTSFCSSADYNIIGFKDPYSPPEYINKVLSDCHGNVSMAAQRMQISRVTLYRKIKKYNLY